MPNRPSPAETPAHGRDAVGYTVLRAGPAGSELAETCLVAPYAGTIHSARLDAAGRALVLSVADAHLTLSALPEDVVSLLSRAPERVLLVLVDTLSRARQSFHVSELLSGPKPDAAPAA